MIVNLIGVFVTLCYIFFFSPFVCFGDCAYSVGPEAQAKKMLSQSVGADQVAEVIARWTGIPVTKLTKSDKEKLLNLSEELHKRVIGQV